MPKPDPDRDMALINRAAVLAELKQQPAWAELARIVEERKRVHFDSLTRRLIAGQPVDQREVDRMAGYFKGQEDLIARPDLAANQAKSALKRAELFEEGASE